MPRSQQPLPDETIGEYTYLEDAEDIFSRDQPVEKYVRIPEWRRPTEPDDPRILVRGMYAEQRRAFEDRGVNDDVSPTDDNYLRTEWWSKERRYELIVLSCVRRDGKPIFTLRQIEKLHAMAAKPIERLYSAAQEVNGYDRDELRRSGKVDGTETAGSLRTASLLPSVNGTSEVSLQDPTP